MKQTCENCHVSEVPSRCHLRTRTENFSHITQNIMKLVLASALGGAAAFSAVPLTPLTGGRAAATVTMKLSESEQPMSRRAAVLAAAGTAAAAMPVFAAFADDNEDAMLAIARRDQDARTAAHVAFAIKK